jgi:hypothetical protein
LCGADCREGRIPAAPRRPITGGPAVPRMLRPPHAQGQPTAPRTAPPAQTPMHARRRRHAGARDRLPAVPLCGGPPQGPGGRPAGRRGPLDQGGARAGAGGEGATKTRVRGGMGRGGAPACFARGRPQPPAPQSHPIPSRPIPSHPIPSRPIPSHPAPPPPPRTPRPCLPPSAPPPPRPSTPSTSCRRWARASPSPASWRRCSTAARCASRCCPT